ncbi:MAG TPA: hypothetical protein VJ870_10605 [Amycolatopsis sp.]|nr:hypothetical protein [Amycolatopsis sp.]
MGGQFSAALSEVTDPRYVGTIELLPLLAGAVGWRDAVALRSVAPLLGAVALTRRSRPT